MCPGKKRKTWWYQSYRWFKRSVSDHIRAQTAFIAWRETMIYNLRYCRLKLFVYGWLILLLIFWVLTKSTKHLTNSSQQYLYKKKTTTTIIGLTWRLFFVFSSCLFTFSLWRGHAYQAMLSLAMHGSNRFTLKLHRSPLFACLVEDKST